MIQGGKCRSCGAKISVSCPLTELLTGIAFVLVVAVFDVTPAAAMNKGVHQRAFLQKRGKAL